MSDSVKAWHEMQQAEKDKIRESGDFKPAKYIFLLDYIDGKVYRYDISVLCKKQNEWNPDTESCEKFLELVGHKVDNCEWMVTNESKIEYGN